MIKQILDRELVGGLCDSPIYPITSTQAIYSEDEDGQVVCDDNHLLETRLQNIETSLEELIESISSSTIENYQVITDDEIQDLIDTYLLS